MSEEIFIKCKHFNKKDFPACKTYTTIKNGEVFSVGKCESSGSNGICFQKFQLPSPIGWIFEGIANE